MVECAVTDSPALNVLKEAETAQEVTSTTSTLMATMTSAAAPPPGATLATLITNLTLTLTNALVKPLVMSTMPVTKTCSHRTP